MSCTETKVQVQSRPWSGTGVQRWHPLPATRTCQTSRCSLARCSNHRAPERTPVHQWRLPQRACCFSSAPLRADQGHKRGAAADGYNRPCRCLPTGCRAKQAGVCWTGVLLGEGYALTATARLNQPENICAEQQELRRKGSFPRRC